MKQITREEIRAALKTMDLPQGLTQGPPQAVAVRAAGGKPPSQYDRWQDQSLHPDSTPERPVYYLGGPPSGYPVPLRTPLMPKLSYWVLAACQMSVWGNDPDNEGPGWSSHEIADTARCTTGEVDYVLDKYLSGYLEFYDAPQTQDPPANLPDANWRNEFGDAIDIRDVTSRFILAVCKFFMQGMPVTQIAHYSNTSESAIEGVLDSFLADYLERHGDD